MLKYDQVVMVSSSVAPTLRISLDTMLLRILVINSRMTPPMVGVRSQAGLETGPGSNNAGQGAGTA